MKTLALILVLGCACPARAGYTEAAAAIKGIEAQEAKELDVLLAKPGAELARSERATALIADNQKALELFRDAAAVKSDGYLLAPKPEKLSVKTPVPLFAPYLKLLRLALLEAKVKAARGQRAQAEEDILAAAGLIGQISAQKSFMLISSMVERICIQRAFPVIADSLRGKPGDAYLKELSARLAAAARNHDFMQAAFQEDALMSKNTIQETLTPAAFELERAKLPFWKRYTAKRLQDEAFFAMTFDKYAAAADAGAKAYAEAFRANDPAIAETFVTKQQAEAQAKIAAASKRGLWAEFKDGLAGGAEAKARMSDIIAYTLVNIASPAYGKLVPAYHTGLCQLGVLRAALAVKLYQRAKKRLPEKLDELVPAQLEAVPQDSFNKFAPLAYVKTGKKFSIYSFGPDGKDDKGAAELDGAAYLENAANSAGDIVFAD